MSDVSEWVDTVKATEVSEHIHVPMNMADGVTRFVLKPGWNAGIESMPPDTQVDAYVTINGQDYWLTREAVEQFASFIGLKPKYIHRTPGVLVANHLDYWAAYSTKLNLTMAVEQIDSDTFLGTAVTKKQAEQFSVAALCEKVAEAYAAACDEPVENLLIHESSHHDKHLTRMRVMLNDVDDWDSCPGVQFTVSQLSEVAMTVEGFMGSVENAAGIIQPGIKFTYSRLHNSYDVEEISEWLDECVKVIADAGTDHETTILNELSEQPVPDVVQVMADLFKTYSIPLKVRQSILDLIDGADSLSYADVVMAVAASGGYNMPDHFRTKIMTIAGTLIRDIHERCEKCQQTLH